MVTGRVMRAIYKRANLMEKTNIKQL